MSCTSLPKAPINWGLEWLPNITVQINQFLTRRLTYFLCIKCPLIKLPFGRIPSVKSLVLPWWWSAPPEPQPIWCVSSLWQEGGTKSWLLVWVHICTFTEMWILTTGEVMIISLIIANWQTYLSATVLKILWRILQSSIEYKDKQRDLHCPRGNEAAVTAVSNPA